ncbi:MAG TPA: hypothetical protein VF982_11160, partial [Anaerolineales bacterium]
IGVNVFIAEWGVDSNLSRFPVAYRRPQPDLQFDRRHILFMLLPVVLVIAIYLGSALKKNTARWAVPAIALGTGLAWWLARDAIFAGQTPELLISLQPIVLLGLLGSMPALASNRERFKVVWQIGLLGVVVLALLVPKTRYHARDWQDERQLMLEYRQAAAFLLDTDPSTPIVLATGGPLRLYSASDFRLAYDWPVSTAPVAQPRIVSLDLDEPHDEDVYVLYEDADGRNRDAFVDPDWEQVVQFGDETNRWRILIYLVPALD